MLVGAELGQTVWVSTFPRARCVPSLVVMAGYVVEVYVSRLSASVLDETSSHARRAAENLSRAGTPVVYICSIFLPEDETCFHFFEAPSLEAIQETCSRLGLTFERIAEATSTGLPMKMNPGASS